MCAGYKQIVKQNYKFPLKHRTKHAHTYTHPIERRKKKIEKNQIVKTKSKW